MRVKMVSEKILIVGVNSVIGGALAAALSARGRDVLGTTRRANANGASFLDLANVDDWFPPKGITVAVLTAAMDQQQCLRDPDLSRRVNVDNTLKIARRLIEEGARIVFPSTNLVFDCTQPNHPANSSYRPLNRYAAQKVEVEESLLRYQGIVNICRLVKLLTSKLPLISLWLDDLVARRTICAFSDLNVAPVSLKYTTEFLIRVLGQAENGIFQITGAQELSYCKLARMLALRLDRPTSLVRCCSSAEVGVNLPAAPRYPSLDAGRTKKVLKLEPQAIQNVLDELVESSS